MVPAPDVGLQVPGTGGPALWWLLPYGHPPVPEQVDREHRLVRHKCGHRQVCCNSSWLLHFWLTNGQFFEKLGKTLRPAGKPWPCKTRWPPFAFMTCWLSWTTSIAALPWRTTSCSNTTYAKSRGTYRSVSRQSRFHVGLKCLWQPCLSNSSPGSLPGRPSTHGHDNLQEPEGRAEHPGHGKERRSKTLELFILVLLCFNVISYRIYNI